MIRSKTLLLIVVQFLFVHALEGASFQNLNFEATALSPDGPGGLQPIDIALPGWSARFSDGHHPLVLYNEEFAGTAYVGLAGTRFRPLAGQFSAVLQPGTGATGSLVSVSLAQTGTIPVGVTTLQFLGSAGAFHPTIRDYFGVYIDGQRLDVFPPFNQPGGISATFTADISQYSGREVTLQFTSFQLGGYPNGLALDNIAFVVPEPSTWALLGLLGLSVLALGYRCCYHLRWRAG